ncbi:hypothetical protein D623_10027091 [Myotis brandtii]|uniref:Uncharacterized protein n=1 Tax=Myotis brandtii TaxID=109478 RepID=S7Q5M6_MYOBR|nr:hypothetical protein D623_10027091 [Myotis brandtii]
MECLTLASAVTVEKEGSQGTPYQIPSLPPFSNSGFFNRCVQDDVGAKIREPLDKFFNDTPGTLQMLFPLRGTRPFPAAFHPSERTHLQAQHKSFDQDFDRREVVRNMVDIGDMLQSLAG